MADYATVSRVAKILARATSPEENEAKSALDHAYKRMVRDGVTLQDLLTLPEAELFQDALVRLVDVILNNQADLSPSAKRAAYAEYMRLIVAKFSGAGQGGASSERATGDSSREEQARAYRERHGYQERQDQSRRQEQDFTQEKGKTDKRANDNTAQQEKEQTTSQENAPNAAIQVFEFMRPWFQRGGIVWLFFHEPAIMFRLSGASILWGMAFALVLVTIAALGHIVTDTKPVMDVSFNALFGALTAIGTLWRMRLFLKSAR